jgi:F0F1-type ATP synthase epsilon subunit
MELTIVGTNIYTQDEIEWLEVTTDIGSFVIQQGYAPSLLILAPGKDFCYKPLNQDTQTLVVKKGILSVDRETATLLIHMQ